MSGVPAGIEAARAAKATLAERLSGEPLVNGLGLARAAGGWAVKVNLVREAPELELPSELDGVEVRSEVVGRIDAA